MTLPYWIESTLAALPAFLWVYFGLGLPGALALLPRADWRDRPLALALAFACGPSLLTAWMLALGVAGLLRLDLTLAGTVALAVIGAGIAWARRAPPVEPAPPRAPLAFDERLLLLLIGLALIVRPLVMAYWPFTAYDALWVYGYQGRLYTLLGAIPPHIDYYPQFLQLQYTFGQLFVGGIDDHAARAALPLLHTGSILAAYALGARLVSRRAGIIAAALWALYPHLGSWSRFGDLEVPLTFLFTLAALFFLLAWRGGDHRRRYALIAGLMLGAAMWTKPTAGAFIWGVLLLLAADLIRIRFDLRAWWPRFETALITGAACIPLGAAWYVRNGLLGHNLIDFPPGYWLTQAARSGAEFGWPLLALALAVGYAAFGPPRWRDRRIIPALALIAAGLLPSLIRVYTDPANVPAGRIGGAEWAALAAGVALLGWAARPLLRRADGRALMVGWGLLLALPYFVTWFYSYSYHPRLSFAIVPLLILPSAALLAVLVDPRRYARRGARALAVPALIALGLPGALIALEDVHSGWDVIFSDRLPDDMARYRSGNAALMAVVDGLMIYEAQHGAPPVVVAPNVVRLPFFFPLADIRTETAPTRLDELEGVTDFIEGAPEGGGAYGGIPITQNQVIGALARASDAPGRILRRAWGFDDGFFRYNVYELSLENRFLPPATFHNLIAPDADVVFGDFARFGGHNIIADVFWPGRAIFFQMYWEVLATPATDYSIFIHLVDADGALLANWDGPVTNTGDGRYYATTVWEPGEFITDTRNFRPAEGIPASEGNRLIIGLYDPLTNIRVPVTVDGEPGGDGFTLSERITVLEAEPSD